MTTVQSPKASGATTDVHTGCMSHHSSHQPLAAPGSTSSTKSAWACRAVCPSQGQCSCPGNQTFKPGDQASWFGLGCTAPQPGWDTSSPRLLLNSTRRLTGTTSMYRLPVSYPNSTDFLLSLKPAPTSGPIVLPGKQASLPGLGTLPCSPMATSYLLHSPLSLNAPPRHLHPLLPTLSLSSDLTAAPPRLTCDGQGHHQTTTPFETWRVTCQKRVTTHVHQ